MRPLSYEGCEATSVQVPLQAWGAVPLEAEQVQREILGSAPAATGALSVKKTLWLTTARARCTTTAAPVPRTSPVAPAREVR